MIAPAQCEHGKLALQQALACKGNDIRMALEMHPNELATCQFAHSELGPARQTISGTVRFSANPSWAADLHR